MSEERSKLLMQGDEVVSILTRSADFTKELLQENEELRLLLIEVEKTHRLAAQDPDGREKLGVELLARIHSLEEENRSFREQLLEVEDENRRFADRYLEIEDENNNLTNLYVASYQLHSTLELEEVVKIVLEIVIELIGAEVFALYLLERDDVLQPVAVEGVPRDQVPHCTMGQGRLGKAVLASQATCWDPEGSDDLTQPIVVIPLQIQKRTIGAIALFKFVQPKQGFSELDHELFNVLGGHASTAILAARLYSQSERKLNTIRGFLDLLAQ